MPPLTPPTGVDLARQRDAAQLLHHRRGQGADPSPSAPAPTAARWPWCSPPWERAFLHRRGNTAEYANFQLHRRPLEYRSGAIFNDMVTGILLCDKAGDLSRERHADRRRPGDRHGVRLLGRGRSAARFQPGFRPIHGFGARWRIHRLPAPVRRVREGRGFLGPVSEPWSAQGAAPRPGETRWCRCTAPPTGRWLFPNPLAITDRWTDDGATSFPWQSGKIATMPSRGYIAAAATVDLTRLDETVQRLVTRACSTPSLTARARPSRACARRSSITGSNT